DVEARAALTPDERRQLGEAERLSAELRVLMERRKFQEAEPLARRDLAIRQKVLGDDHPLTARYRRDLTRALF
ncbi:MAG TPA: tetratricopeptide repeat protein, partial [Actinomycetes bacterium]|nr:tetratricopeptide repeat protein [Actinomycetes bacterium]